MVVVDPLVTLDVWRRIQPLSASDNRCVTLLWSPVSFYGFTLKTFVFFTWSLSTLSNSAHPQETVGGEATPVNIQGYKLEWSQGGQTSTELKDGGQNQAVVFIGPGRCDVTVRAVLQTGSSLPGNITVPPKDVTGKQPEKQQFVQIL